MRLVSIQPTRFEVEAKQAGQVCQRVEPVASLTLHGAHLNLTHTQTITQQNCTSLFAFTPLASASGVCWSYDAATCGRQEASTQWMW